jgi:peptidoglycan/LPS O-acetylase OafA/YrhL
MLSLILSKRFLPSLFFVGVIALIASIVSTVVIARYEAAEPMWEVITDISYWLFFLLPISCAPSALKALPPVSTVNIIVGYIASVGALVTGLVIMLFSVFVGWDTIGIPNFAAIMLCFGAMFLISASLLRGRQQSAINHSN